jgi:hypothetical protein
MAKFQVILIHYVIHARVVLTLKSMVCRNINKTSSFVSLGEGGLWKNMLSLVIEWNKFTNESLDFENEIRTGGGGGGANNLLPKYNGIQ